MFLFEAPCFSRNPLTTHGLSPSRKRESSRASPPSPTLRLKNSFLPDLFCLKTARTGMKENSAFIFILVCCCFVCLFVFWLFVGVFLAVHGKCKFFLHFPRVGKITKAWESKDSISTTSTPRSAFSSPLSSRCCCTVLKRGG